MPSPRFHPRWAYLAFPVCAALALGGVESPAVDAPPPAGLSSKLPPEPVFDDSGAKKEDDPPTGLEVFGRFSWDEFIALNWRAHDTVRGEPDQEKSLAASGERVVWGSWKSLDDLFPIDDPEKNPPGPWGDPGTGFRARQYKDGKLSLAPSASAADKDAGKRHVLGQANRLGTVVQSDMIGRPLAPLIAGNGTYVRYDVRVNRVAYEFVTRNKFYLAKNLPSQNGHLPKGFDDESVIVKAAWMELTPKDTKHRFYHIPASVAEWTEDGVETLRDVTVGLVGLHIARKTKARPSWVWSTFEHADNVPARTSFGPPPPVLPKIEGVVSAGGVNYKPVIPPDRKPLPAQPPVHVTRVNDVPDAIHRVNAEYHQKVGVRGTVWQNYSLVGVQRAALPDRGNPNADRPHFIPPKGGANTTIETYRQTSTCLGCHTSARDTSFVFFPTLRAVPQRDP